MRYSQDVLTNNLETPFRNLDGAERWMVDGLRVSKRTDFFVTQEIDMSKAKQRIEDLKSQGHQVSFTHIFVRATALTLAENPDLHQLVIDHKRYLPKSPSIGLSISGSTVVAPVMVIDQADRKSLVQIATEVKNSLDDVRKENEHMLATLRKWGWLVPFGWLRQFIISLLSKDMGFIRSKVGTFQVTCLKDMDHFAPLLISTGAALGVGRVKDRIIVENEDPVVTPTAFVTVCCDHKVWDGRRASEFTNALKRVLEQGEF